MAKDNDEVQHNNNSSNIIGSSNNSNNNGLDTLLSNVGVPLTSDATEVTDCATEMKLADVVAAADKGNVNSAGGGDCASNSVKSDQFGISTTTYMRGKLNDLVADLCINGPMSGGNDKNGGYGDYTKSNPATNIESATQRKVSGATWEPVSNSSVASQQYIPQPHTAPTQNASSFSFKHFLSSGPPITAPSSTVTVTSLDATTSNSANGPLSNNSTSSNTASLQTSTGARPKVPQSTSLSSTSISSLMGSGGGATTGGSGQPDGGNTFGTSATKMKRSPRFSSFDSQASLAEYVTEDAGGEIENVSDTTGSGVRVAGNVGGCASTGFRLYPESSDFFSSSPRNWRGMDDEATAGGISNTNEYNRHQYVPRSYSNYEMPMSSSPRRRVTIGKNIYSIGTGGTKEARPTRLALNTSSSKSKVNLPLGDMSSSSGACGGGAAGSVAAPPSVTRPLPSNAGEFPAAVLPDFVQDHWLDSWYAHDMHLSSPPNSPIPDYNDDDIGTCGAMGSGGGGGTVSGGNNGGVCDLACGNGVSAVIGIPGPSSPTYGNMAACGGGSGVVTEATSNNAKMLPDFLSDGPIIHSSQRLADVTVGLPSNSIGSPDDPPISSQLSRLRIQNERLQHELNEARIALNEQTLHANDLERQLQQTRELQKQQLEEVKPNERAAEGVADKSKRMRVTASTTGVALNYVTELKQQVAHLTAEVKALRRENETLREEGAVGGFNAPYCESSRPFVTDASGGGSSSAAAGAGTRGAVGRPCRTQQISRDLLRAASNAENNLRQLLVGVDNLRQMAADIENSDNRVGYDVSPDLFSDFPDDCDDYEDYSDGPTL
ncbi:uncharacterized protein l(3)04053 [Eurosta solidaginis]|uniref:uncharacterized protein l(3)04053 n=1 Tax=Eurosta solidaginis TaxID=178769 RepID=UPI0035311FCB